MGNPTDRELRRQCILLARITGTGIGWFYDLPLRELGAVTKEVNDIYGG